MLEHPADVTRVPVALGNRSYDIMIGEGLLSRAGALMAPHVGRRRTTIVTDETVAELHLGTLQGSLHAAGIAAEAVVLVPGEQRKSFAELARLCDRLLELGVERGDTIVAFGGGVIGDLAGFAAAILRRGVDFVQVPTTLLAQVDSSVGGKTAINSLLGKNLIGAFHQPRLVIADVNVLATLDARQMRAGYAEIIKYGLIDRPDFFAWLEENGAALLANDRRLIAQAVAECCRAKAAVVAADEHEAGVRALLNLGHSFGHALEAEAGYDGRLLHGEAVAVGCVMAFAVSSALGLCPADDVTRLRRHLAAVGLPTNTVDVGLGGITAERLMAHMRQDKKVKDGRMTLVLARGIGDSFLTDEVPPERLTAAIAAFLAANE